MGPLLADSIALTEYTSQWDLLALLLYFRIVSIVSAEYNTQFDLVLAESATVTGYLPPWVS